jgi:hypothetical protein
LKTREADPIHPVRFDSKCRKPKAGFFSFVIVCYSERKGLRLRRQILRRVLAVMVLAAMLALLAIPAWADTPPGDSDTARVQANSEIQSVYTGV